MNIVLFGVKGCGKTTLGKKVAQKLGKAFIDTDELISEVFFISHGKRLTCPEIYAQVGPMGFRSLEFEVIQSLQDVQNSIIAVGGGAMTLIDNVEALKKTSHLVYLFMDRVPLKKRVLAFDPLPAFLDPNDPESSFDRMYDERDDFFRKLETKEINITELEEQAAVDQISSIYHESEKSNGK